jgi:hypothetical protein
LAKRNEKFVFLWARCADGYEVWSDGTFHPLGNAWSEYEPAIDASDIHQILASLEPTEQNFHEFVSEYGALTDHSDEDATCSVDELKKLRDTVRLSLDAWNVGEKDTVIERLYFSEKPLLRLSLDLSSEGKLEYESKPIDLASFIVFQLIKELSGGLEWKTCEAPGCSRRFAVSSGLGAITKRQTKTKRRKFCNGACRQAADREKRKAKKNG